MLIQKVTISHKFANEMMNKYPQIRVNNIYSKIGELRLKKSPQEVEKIKKAIEMAQKDDIVIIAGKGHENYQI